MTLSLSLGRSTSSLIFRKFNVNAGELFYPSRRRFQPQTRFNTMTRPNNNNIIVSRLKDLVRIKMEIPKVQFPSIGRLKSIFSSFQSGVKIMGRFVGKECRPIFAQRVFRTYRVVHWHSKLWSSSALALALRPLSGRALLSFLFIALCDSEIPFGEKVLETELHEHMKDLDFIRELTAATVMCPHCQNRLVVDKRVPNVKYCHCPDAKSAYDRKVEGYGWTPFVETPDLLVWRMPHPDRPGLYMYKVYGFYDDISAEDFLSIQLDIDYRKEWDDSVLKLEAVETNEDISQEIIYWALKWPTMFSNRDYLFARRHLIDHQKRGVILISKAVAHPSYPDRKGLHRVKEYWSVMQINSPTGLSDPGVEFGLTYFDNPGVALPQWMTNWAAMTAIPEFLDKQRNAARARKKSGKSYSRKVFTKKPPDSGPPGLAGVKPDEALPKNEDKTSQPSEDQCPSPGACPEKCPAPSNISMNIININPNSSTTGIQSQSHSSNSYNNSNCSTTSGQDKILLSQFFMENVLLR